MIQDGFNEALYLKRVPVNVFSTALNTLDPTGILLYNNYLVT